MDEMSSHVNLCLKSNDNGLPIANFPLAVHVYGMYLNRKTSKPWDFLNKYL
jgi:hypothetical protein